MSQEPKLLQNELQNINMKRVVIFHFYLKVILMDFIFACFDILVHDVSQKGSLVFSCFFRLGGGDYSPESAQKDILPDR